LGNGLGEKWGIGEKAPGVYFRGLVNITLINNEYPNYLFLIVKL
jgi:hypothetical protein